MSSNAGPSQDALRLAYQEAYRGFESIQAFRVKLLAFLPLASGTGVFLLLGTLPQGARVHLPAVGAFGFLMTVGLFLYELHAMRDCKHLLACVAVLERKLDLPSGDYRAYLDNLKLVGIIGAAWVIYPTVMFAWAYTAYVHLQQLWVFLLPALVVVGGFPVFLRQLPGWRQALYEAWQGKMAATQSQSPPPSGGSS